MSLTDIEESSLAGERLLLALRNGEGLTLDVDQPAAAACRDGRGRPGDCADESKDAEIETQARPPRPVDHRRPDIDPRSAAAGARRRDSPYGDDLENRYVAARNAWTRAMRAATAAVRGPRVARDRPGGLRSGRGRARALAGRRRWRSRIEPDPSATTSRSRSARSSRGARCSTPPKPRGFFGSHSSSPGRLSLRSARPVALGGLRPIPDAELPQHAADVALDRARRDGQRAGDLAIGQALGEEPQDVQLARAQQARRRRPDTPPAPPR